MDATSCLTERGPNISRHVHRDWHSFILLNLSGTHDYVDAIRGCVFGCVYSPHGVIAVVMDATNVSELYKSGLKCSRGKKKLR